MHTTETAQHTCLYFAHCVLSLKTDAFSWFLFSFGVVCNAIEKALLNHEVDCMCARELADDNFSDCFVCHTVHLLLFVLIYLTMG